MKKLLIIIALCTIAATSAHAQFFYGAQFGFYTDGNSKGSGTEFARGASSFNVSIKPNVGYFFNPRLVAGLKLDFINCSLVDNDTGSMSLFDIDYYAINLLMGNGLSRDYMSFKVAPYVRYQVLSLFNDKVKIWAELNGYWGMKYPRDTDHKLDIASRSMIYGAELHPLVSYDLVNNYMIYTSLDFLSLTWNGETKRHEDSIGVEYATINNKMWFQCNPLVALARAFLQIGVMKKF